MCVLLTTSWSESQKDCQAIFIKLSCFCQDQFTHPIFTSNHFKFHFFWKTCSLASDDFCNISSKRVFVGTNGECKKYKNCCLNDWSFPLLIAEFLQQFLTCYLYPISVNPYFFRGWDKINKELQLEIISYKHSSQNLIMIIISLNLHLYLGLFLTNKCAVFCKLRLYFNMIQSHFSTLKYKNWMSFLVLSLSQFKIFRNSTSSTTT